MRCRSRPVSKHKRFDHLPYRERFPDVALRICREEPVETKIGIVGPLLFWKQQGKSCLIRKLGPARASIIPRRTLGAAMQHNDQRRAFGQVLWEIVSRSQRSRIGTKA